jgi:CRP-like cAMP-binding protein
LLAPASYRHFRHLSSVHSRIAAQDLLSRVREPDVRESTARIGRDGAPVRNHVLLSLSDDEFETLRPHLNYQPFPKHATLHESGENLEVLHFPNTGLVSIVVATRNGKTVEVAIVGREGLIGTAAIVGLARSPNRAVVQVAGNGFRLRTDALRSVMASNPLIQAVFSRYAAIQGMQTAQSAA